MGAQEGYWDVDLVKNWKPAQQRGRGDFSAREAVAAVQEAIWHQPAKNMSHKNFVTKSKKNCQFDDGSPDLLEGQAAVGNQEVLVEKDMEAPLVLPT